MHRSSAHTLGLAIALALSVTTVLAASPDPARGTWVKSLSARDINGDGTIDAWYDALLNLTWLADVNAIAGTAYDSDLYFGTRTDGLVTFADAVAWASSLNVYGITGWRLPRIESSGAPYDCNMGYSGTDCGFNVRLIGTNGRTLSEYPHLWKVTLGNQPACVEANSGCYFPTTSIPNQFGPFRNLADGRDIWQASTSGDRIVGSKVFVNATGESHNFFMDDEQYQVLAVHDGDVMPAAIPEPASAWLAAMGLGLMGVVVRRSRREAGASQ